MIIKWQEKIYKGTPEKLIEMIEASPWTKGIKTIKMRVKQFYGVEIKETNARGFLNELADLKEIEIIKN